MMISFSGSLVIKRDHEPFSPYTDESETEVVIRRNLEESPAKISSSLRIEMLILGITVVIVAIMAFISAFNYVKMTFTYISESELIPCYVFIKDLISHFWFTCKRSVPDVKKSLKLSRTTIYLNIPGMSSVS